MLGRPVQFYQENRGSRPHAPVHISPGMRRMTFRVNRRLTMNLGLRYELPLQTVALNYAVMPNTSPGAQSKIYPTAPPGLLFWGDPGVTRSGTDTPTKSFAPRVGISYGLTPPTTRPCCAPATEFTSIRTGRMRPGSLPSTSRSPAGSISTPPSTSNPWANYAGGNPFPSTPSLGETGATPGKRMLYSILILPVWRMGRISGHSCCSNGIFGFCRTRGNRKELAGYCRLCRKSRNPYPLLAGYECTRLYPRTIDYGKHRSAAPPIPLFFPLQPDRVRAEFKLSTSACFQSINALVQTFLCKWLTHSRRLSPIQDTVLTNTGGETSPFQSAPGLRSYQLRYRDPRSRDILGLECSSGRFQKGIGGVFLGNWQLNGYWSIYSGMPFRSLRR